ncbi:thylakoid-associated protein [Oscillatoriales cyanobacterium USR001]|nr:thylakoid-associated protein [Oscillatoriales cyanobacterium USR001]
MANTNINQAIESLAAEIGDNIYIDVAKWHLYLKDAHLHTMIAEQIYPLLTDKNLDADRVTQIMQNISVKLGGGKLELPLVDLVPRQCQLQLMDILEEFQRKM